MKAMLVLLCLLPIAASAGDPFAEHEQTKHETNVFKRKLYLSQAVEDYCSVQPRGTYRTTLHTQPIEIQCAVRNEWVALYREGVVK